MIWEGFGRSPAWFRAWGPPGAVVAIRIDGNESVRALGAPGDRPGGPGGSLGPINHQIWSRVTEKSTNGATYCSSVSSSFARASSPCVAPPSTANAWQNHLK